MMFSMKKIMLVMLAVTLAFPQAAECADNSREMVYRIAAAGVVTVCAIISGAIGHIVGSKRSALALQAQAEYQRTQAELKLNQNIDHAKQLCAQYTVQYAKELDMLRKKETMGTQFLTEYIQQISASQERYKYQKYLEDLEHAVRQLQQHASIVKDYVKEYENLPISLQQLKLVIQSKIGHLADKNKDERNHHQKEEIENQLLLKERQLALKVKEAEIDNQNSKKEILKQEQQFIKSLQATLEQLNRTTQSLTNIPKTSEKVLTELCNVQKKLAELDTKSFQSDKKQEEAVVEMRQHLQRLQVHMNQWALYTQQMYQQQYSAPSAPPTE